MDQNQAASPRYNHNIDQPIHTPETNRKACQHSTQQLGTILLKEAADNTTGQESIIASYGYNPSTHSLNPNQKILTYLHPDGTQFKVVGSPSKSYAFTKTLQLQNWNNPQEHLYVGEITDETGRSLWMQTQHLGLKGGTPTARVNLTDQYRVQRFRHITTIKYEPIPGEHYITAGIDSQGTLRLSIRAKGERSIYGTGKDMWINLMNKIDEERLYFNRIEDQWDTSTDSDNASEFMSNLERGMNRTEAAKNTWSGRMMGSYNMTPTQFRQSGSSFYVTFE